MNYKIQIQVLLNETEFVSGGRGERRGEFMNVEHLLCVEHFLEFFRFMNPHKLLEHRECEIHFRGEREAPDGDMSDYRLELRFEFKSPSLQGTDLFHYWRGDMKFTVLTGILLGVKRNAINRCTGQLRKTGTLQGECPVITLIINHPYLFLLRLHETKINLLFDILLLSVIGTGKR